MLFQLVAAKIALSTFFVTYVKPSPGYFKMTFGLHESKESSGISVVRGNVHEFEIFRVIYCGPYEVQFLFSSCNEGLIIKCFYTDYSNT